MKHGLTALLTLMLAACSQPPGVDAGPRQSSLTEQQAVPDQTGNAEAETHLIPLERKLTKLAQPPEIPQPDAAEAPAGTQSETEFRDEIAALREDIRALHALLEAYLGESMYELHVENEQLRDEIRRLAVLENFGDISGRSAVPRPGRNLVDEIMSEPGGKDFGPAPAAEEPLALATHNGFNYVIIDEWGRSPGQAAALGQGATSLKGMVLAVPEGSSPADLTALGRWLQKEYAAYDNIVIEVFDDAAAARTYAERHVAQPNSRVLTLTRKQGKEPELYLINGDQATLVPPDAVPDKALEAAREDGGTELLTPLP